MIGIIARYDDSISSPPIKKYEAQSYSTFNGSGTSGNQVGTCFGTNVKVTSSELGDAFQFQIYHSFTGSYHIRGVNGMTFFEGYRVGDI